MRWKSPLSAKFSATAFYSASCSKRSSQLHKMYQSRCTAKNSWWWAEMLPETCRVVIPIKLESSASVGLIHKESVTMHSHTIVKEYCTSSQLVEERAQNVRTAPHSLIPQSTISIPEIQKKNNWTPSGSSHHIFIVVYLGLYSTKLQFCKDWKQEKGKWQFFSPPRKTFIPVSEGI